MEFIKGDLVEAFISGKVNVLGHQANCFNTMGAGIALQIKNKLPDAYAADCRTLKGDRRKLGTLSYAVIGRGIVFNLYGQFKFHSTKRQTDYDALRNSLKLMAIKLMPKQASCKIGLPKLGCGLAGGDWAIVSQIISDELQGFDIKIYEK
jgi:O-acetyl-ADP-ribose deacetylase (regulator of RNase III)